MKNVTLSRRLVLLATAIVPAIASTITVAADTSAIDALWLARLDTLKSLAANGAAFATANEGLPSWAQRGPEFIDHQGNRVGDEVNWPEMRDPSPPTSGASSFRRVRHSFASIRQDFEQWCMVYGSAEYRPKARAIYRQRIRDLVARLREQDAAEKAAGLGALTADSDRLCVALWATEDKIRQLASAGDLNAGAASAIIEMSYEEDHDAALGKSKRILFAAMKPTLTGQVANSVAIMLASDEETSIKEFPFIT
jgi:hypothetical protein